MRIELLSREHNRTGFDCGEISLNTYLSNFARQNQEKGLGRTYVAIEPGDSTIRGYYTLSAGAVTFDQVPDKLPRYPVPVAHIGRLAVDIRFQGLGLGEMLLVDALKKTSDAAESLGIYAVEVRALTDNARKFYLKYGFISMRDDPLHLYIPMKVVRKLQL